METRIWLLIMFIISFCATGAAYLVLLSEVNKFKKGLPNVLDGYELYTVPMRRIRRTIIYFSMGIALSVGAVTAVMMI